MNLANLDATTLGYHGTLGIYMKTIEDNGFRKSFDPECFLGEGVYFYEQQPAKAKSWARKKRAKSSGSNGVVVFEAKIRLGYCLNLADQDVVDEILKLMHDVERKTSVAITDLTAIALVAKLAAIDTIRAVRFAYGTKPIFADSRYTADIETVICVRNEASILSKRVFWKEQVRS